MKDRWLLRGPQFGNCNCAYGCPCQFGSPTTNGFCQAFGAVSVTEGYFNDVRLDGLSFVLILQWPGEIAQGNGRSQAIVGRFTIRRRVPRKTVFGMISSPEVFTFFDSW